ncbi:hypothetical protein I656_01641 [Geobacillus sp. WSUCF1]|nr:hypothetical protein I656_01641 [Geobacillus sp. WSUCF1]
MTHHLPSPCSCPYAIMTTTSLRSPLSYTIGGEKGIVFLLIFFGYFLSVMGQKQIGETAFQRWKRKAEAGLQ